MNICNVISHKFYIKTHKNKKHKPENVCYCYKKNAVFKRQRIVSDITSTQTQCLAIGHYVHINVWNIIAISVAMTTVKVEKGKKISSGAFYEVSKTQQTGIKQKKKILHWRDLDIWKYCQITQAIWDLNKKYNVFLCKEQNVKSLTWKMSTAGCDNMKYLQ